MSGLDGIDRKLDPGPSADTPYEAEAPPLPRSLGEALAACGDDKALRAGFGDFFVDYYLKLKRPRSIASPWKSATGNSASTSRCSEETKGPSACGLGMTAGVDNKPTVIPSAARDL